MVDEAGTSGKEGVRAQPISLAWVWVAVTVALVGIGLSAYTLSHHLAVHAQGRTDAACNLSATVSCDTVALSPYSEVFNVPLGVFGIGYFAAMAVLALVAGYRPRSAADHFRGYGLLAAIGVLSALVLAGLAITVVKSWCLVCMGVYGVTFAQGLVWWWGQRSHRGMAFALKSAGNGALTGAVVVAIAVASFNALRPKNQSLPVVVHGGESGGSTGRPNATMDLAPAPQEIPISRSAYSGLGEDYRLGADDATVTIVEFADFECPACAGMSENLEAIHREFGPRVAIVFRNYPLDASCNAAIKGRMHLYACKAAVMARCAGQYGKFWEYFRRVYAGQRELSDERLKAWAGEIGLSPAQVATCWDSRDLLDKVKDDIALGNKLGIDSTPTLFINGRKLLTGRGLDDLRATVHSMLP